MSIPSLPEARRLSPIYLLGVTFIMAWHTTLPFVAVYARSLGASAPVVGLVVSTTVLLSLLFGVKIGALVDTIGVARVARWSAGVFVLAYALMATSHGLWWLAVALAVAGFADIGLVVGSQTYVATESAPAERDRNFGYYTLWVSLGALLGPILGGVLADRWGYPAVFTGSMVLAFLTLAVTAILPGRTAARREAARDVAAGRIAFEMLRQPGLRLVMLVNAAAMFAFSVRQSFYPVYYESLGLTASTIGVIFSLNSLCGMLVRPLIDAAVRRLGYVRLLGASLCLTGVPGACVRWRRDGDGVHAAADDELGLRARAGRRQRDRPGAAREREPIGNGHWTAGVWVGGRGVRAAGRVLCGRGGHRGRAAARRAAGPERNPVTTVHWRPTRAPRSDRRRRSAGRRQACARPGAGLR
jgi:MFS family permease